MQRPDFISESLKHMIPLMETVRDPLLVLDSDLRIIKASRSFYTTFKVTPEETMGRYIYDLGNKQWDIPKLRELLETILPTKNSFDDYLVEHEFSTIGKRIMLLNARQVNIEPSEERIILLAFEDITERKRQEDLVIDSEKRFRRLFETASDGIVLLEKNEGRVVQANKAFESMLGHSETDSVGKSLEDIGVPIDTHDFSKIMRNLEKSDILNFTDIAVQNRSGQVIHTDIYMVDKAELVQCNIRDVTEHNRTKNALLSSQRIFEKIINAIPVRVFWKDKNLVFMGCNTAFANDAGLADPKDIIGKDDYQMVWSDQAELYRNDDLQVIRSGDAKMLIEELQTTPEGDTVTLLTSKIPLINNHGEVSGIIGNYMDITERKKAEEENVKLQSELHQSQKMEAIGTMAGGIAHDFNNILTIIIGNAEFVSDEFPDDYPYREPINEIIKASYRAKDLISQILAFSRKEKKELITISLESIIKETLNLIRSITPTTVSIVQSISQDCGRIKADPTSLHQLLMNLFTNAVQSMDEKGEVSVSLEEVHLESDDLSQVATTTKFFSIKTPGTYARLSVTDTGAGMDEETVSRIFDPFYTTKEVGKGTGMGLSVVLGIVESHGGFIDVDSEPGRGSTFHVFFPIAEAEEEEFVETVTISPQTGTERILFIDDEEALLVLGKRILDKLGYEVTAEKSSLKALEIFKSAPDQFDLIITDQTMPNMSGTELVAEIVKVRPGIPVILCTGFSSKVSEENAREKGISKLIIKPFAKRFLVEAVREVLDGKV